MNPWGINMCDLIVNNVSNPDIKKRWEKYVAAGYVAVMMVKYNV